MNAEDSSKSTVKVKGKGKSLWVSFDPEEPVDRLESEMNRLFGELKQLAKNARVTFDIGERDGYTDITKRLGDHLKNTFGVRDVVLSDRSVSVERSERRQSDMESAWNRYRSDVLMMAGRVRSGQRVTAKRHLVLLGDVNPGGEILAGGDVIVVGRLRGKESAGRPSDASAIVLALDFRPTQVQIGVIVAAGLPQTESHIAEFAHVEDGAIVVDDYRKTDPFGRLTWPEVR